MATSMKTGGKCPPKKNYSGRGSSLEFVKLNEISIENTYLRLDTDVADLEKSIQALGLLSPLVIDSENLLLAGGRRYSALKNLGHDKVWVKRARVMH